MTTKIVAIPSGTKVNILGSGWSENIIETIQKAIDYYDNISK